MKIKILSTLTLVTGGIFLCSTLAGWMDKPVPASPEVIKQSVAKSLLLLQQSGYIFTNNT